MCDHQHRFALGKLGKSRLYLCFIVRVGKGGGLVQDQDGRIFQQDVYKRQLYNHIQSIYDKLGAKNAIEAYNKAIALGYITPLI